MRWKKCRKICCRTNLYPIDVLDFLVEFLSLYPRTTLIAISIISNARSRFPTLVEYVCRQISLTSAFTSIYVTKWLLLVVSASLLNSEVEYTWIYESGPRFLHMDPIFGCYMRVFEPINNKDFHLQCINLDKGSLECQLSRKPSIHTSGEEHPDRTSKSSGCKAQDLCYSMQYKVEWCRSYTPRHRVCGRKAEKFDRDLNPNVLLCE